MSFHNPVYVAGCGGEPMCLCLKKGEGAENVDCPLHHTSAISLSSSSNTTSQSSAYNSDLNDNIVESVSIDISHRDKLINK